MGYCPPLDWICLPAFARFRCFFGARWSKRNGRNGFALIWARHMFAPRYHICCFDITAFYHNNRKDCLHIQSLNDLPRICIYICRCINLPCIALHERREAKNHPTASPKAAREPGHDKTIPNCWVRQGPLAARAKRCTNYCASTLSHPPMRGRRWGWSTVSL